MLYLYLLYLMNYLRLIFGCTTWDTLMKVIVFNKILQHYYQNNWAKIYFLNIKENKNSNCSYQNVKQTHALNIHKD